MTLYIISTTAVVIILCSLAHENGFFILIQYLLDGIFALSEIVASTNVFTT